MAEAPRKRSRFDQTELEPKRSTRFDRRSRSPSGRDSESHRSRSPLKDSPQPQSGGGKKDPAAAAAAAAAKINAQIEQRKGIQQVDVPPIRTPSVGGAKSPSGQSTSVSGDVYQQDGDYIKDIEINDLRNRYLLTKGSTQKMIKDETGADITTRGNYYPDKTMATAANPPLYLHITSQTREGLDKAHSKITEMMQQELPNLVDERRFRRREPEPQVERDELGRRKWPEERIPIDLEPIPGFNLRAQVVGHGGAYVKHIQGETRCRVQIKGRGSGFTERDTQMESDEPMYLHVAGPDANDVARAKELCEDLLGNVREQYQQFKARGPRQPHHGGYHHQQHGEYGERGGYRGHRDGGYGGGGYGGGGYHNDPRSPSAAGAGSPGGEAGQGDQGDYAAQWAQWYASNGQGQQSGDPYAAYGGYQNYMNMYYQYYQSQGQQPGQEQQPGTEGYNAGSNGYAGAPQPLPPASGSPPPPPPGEDSAPPPPPPPAGNPPGTSGGYNAVPPPPGM